MKSIGYGASRRISLLLLGAFLIPQFTQAVTIFNMGKVDPLQDFVVGPARQEIFINPGETVTKEITVTSRVTEPTTFKIDLEDFGGTDQIDNPIQLMGADKNPLSIRDSIIPEVTQFNLKFGERITIPVTIKVPADAAPGGFYTSIIVSNEIGQAKGGSEGATTHAVSRAGSLLFIRVNGEAKEEGKVEDFRITPHHFIYEPGTFGFETMFSNTGNVHLAPYGQVTVNNIFGKTVASAPIDAYYSLPQSKRYRQVNIDGSGLFGIYRAHLELHKAYNNPGHKDEIDSKTITFVVIPWKILLAIFILIILMLVIFRYVFRNFDIRRK